MFKRVDVTDGGARSAPTQMRLCMQQTVNEGLGSIELGRLKSKKDGLPEDHSRVDIVVSRT